MNFENYVKRYPVSKTLCFQLVPIGETEKNLKEHLQNDRKLSEDTTELKQLITSYHREFLTSCLESSTIGWTGLLDAYDNQDSWDSVSAMYRKQIMQLFGKDIYKITGKTLITKTLPEFIESRVTSEKQEHYSSLVRQFAGLSSILGDFYQNLLNIYSDEPKHSAASFRIVHENFPVFVGNVHVYNKIVEKEPRIIKQAETNLASVLTGIGQKLSDVFDISYYNRVLSQPGIDVYNMLLGGWSMTGSKVQGLNELINLHNQSNPQDKLPLFTPLLKQVLGDKIVASFKYSSYESDQEVVDDISSFCYNDLCLHLSDNKNVLYKLADVLSNISSYDATKLFVNQRTLSDISKKLLGTREVLSELCKDNCQKQTDKDKFDKKRLVSLSEMNDAILARNNLLLSSGEEALPVQDVFGYWDTSTDIPEVMRRFASLDAFLQASEKTLSLRNINKAHQFLRSVLDLFYRVRSVSASKDEMFMGDLGPNYKKLGNAIPLYNKVRNYVTRKPKDVANKFRLTFGYASLGEGWAVKNEKENGCVVLRKNNEYFLGVLNKNDKPDFSSIPRGSNEGLLGVDGVGGEWEKMVYNQIPDPSKFVTCLVEKEGKTQKLRTNKDPDGVNRALENEKNTWLPQDINEIRKNGTFKTDKKAKNKYVRYYSQRMIDYMKEKHPSISYDFKKPADYENWEEFLGDIKKQSYSVVFETLADDPITDMVKEGRLFLFRIHSKDFSEKAKGKKDHQTALFQTLFSDSNRTNPNIQLNGNAKLFYRDPIKDKKIIHKKGSVLVNKHTSDGKTVPSEVYLDLCRYYNGQQSSLTEESKKWKDSVRTRVAPYDIIKNRRYYSGQFSLHMTVTCNFLSDEKLRDTNQRIMDDLQKEDSDYTILGIDRGERNLLYITLIDKKGNIVFQKSLNTIGHINYHDKLSAREAERDESRKNWEQLESIKDLKNGYMSRVVNEISEIVIQNNAVIALENLNWGFKQSRSHIEKQVYQKIENALVAKLGYLTLKTVSQDEPGGAGCGYQLTNPMTSAKNKRFQNGIMFFVPPSNTSAIDPTTGYIQPLFCRYESVEKAKKLIADKIKDIRYNTEQGYFEFDVPDRDFSDHIWTVCSYGDLRWFWSAADKKTVPVNITEELKKLFDEHNIKLEEDIRKQILNQITKEFFQRFLFLLGTTMRVRFSHANADNERDKDFILSPVKNKNNKFFDSRAEHATMPHSADANGAYNIADKARWMIQTSDKTTKTSITKEWRKAMMSS